MSLHSFFKKYILALITITPFSLGFTYLVDQNHFKIKKYLIVVVLAFLGCNFKLQAQSEDLFNFSRYSFNPSLEIGQGYKSETNLPVYNRIFDPIITKDTAYSALCSRFLLLNEVENIFQLTNASMDLSVKSLNYKLNAKFNFLKNASISSNSITYALDYFIIRKKSTFQASGSELTDSFLVELKRNNLSNIYQVYGDKCITEKYYGGRVTILVRLNNLSIGEISSLNSSVGGSYGSSILKASGAASFKQLFEKSRVSKNIECSMAVIGNFDYQKSNDLQNRIANGQISSDDLLNQINIFLNSFNENDLRPLFSTVNDLQNVIPQLLPGPASIDYSDGLILIWKEYQKYNWAVEVVNDIESGLDPRSYNLNPDLAKQLSIAKEGWNAYRRLLKSKFETCKDCISTGNKDVMCCEIDKPAGLKPFTIIPDFPTNVLAKDILEKDRITSYPRSTADVYQLYDIMKFSKPYKGKPNEEYDLIIKYQFKSDSGFVTTPPNQPAFGTNFRLIVNGEIINENLQNTGPIPFNSLVSFGEYSVRIKADTLGFVDARLSINGLYNSTLDPKGQHYLVPIVMTKGSYLILESLDRPRVQIIDRE